MPDTTNRPKPEQRYKAACGLFCPSCTLYIGTTEDPARNEALAREFNLPPENLQCQGCGSDTLGFYCRDCKMKRCSKENGIEFCSECDEYPCDELKRFKEAKPHRIELWENLPRIREIGFEAWFEEMLDHYSCPECGTINSTYDLSCRNCGTAPSCGYVKRHQEEIKAYIRDKWQDRFKNS